MNIVGITACPTGIAHTYMAQEALEEAGRKRGHQIKLETQGAMGAENEITEEDAERCSMKAHCWKKEGSDAERFEDALLKEEF